MAIVVKGPAKGVSQMNYQSAVFGYTCMIDVSARGQGRSTWRSGSWMGKSFDTFGPLGPVIVTADELLHPNSLHVRFWNDGQIRHDYNTDDMEHRVPELVEFATSIMTLNTGDVLSCGTNHEGLGPAAGRRTLRDRDRRHRQHGDSRLRSAQTHVGARHLHGPRLHSPPVISSRAALRRPIIQPRQARGEIRPWVALRALRRTAYS